MTFKVRCTYLGSVDSKLQDGTIYSTLNFYDFSNNEPLSVNLVHSAGNSELVETVGAMLSNEPCELTLRLVPSDKLYRLRLVGLSA